jgi:tripartite-type tricarboxylate transporter receptor subunit TctC
MTVSLRIACYALALWAASGVAGAADYPTHPVRVIVPASTGGLTDVLARVVAQSLSESLGQPFVVDNRLGAGGNIGADAVAKAEPDGYTLLVSPAGPFAFNVSLYKAMPFDSTTAFAHVSLLAQAPVVLMVNPKLPANSVADLIAYAKRNPGRINYATQGVGTIAHLTSAMFASRAGIELVHVPYKGSGPAITDLMSGQVQMMFENTNSASSHIKSGELRALGIGSPRRSPILPDVPTMIEAGFPDFISVAWFGAAAPAGTPPAIVELLSRQMAAALHKTEIAQRLAAVGVEPVGSTPQEMSRFVGEEMTRWRAVARAAGVQPE